MSGCCYTSYNNDTTAHYRERNFIRIDNNGLGARAVLTGKHGT